MKGEEHRKSEREKVGKGEKREKREDVPKNSNKIYELKGNKNKIRSKDMD